VSTFTNGWARGHRESKNSKQETDQTVLTITRALTKTTNCTFRAKKVEVHYKIFTVLRAGSMSPHFLAGSVPSPATFKSVPVPLHAIVNIRLKCGHMSYVSKQIHARDNVVAPFIIISIIIVTLPVTTLHCLRLFGEVQNSFAIPLYAAQHFPTNTVTLSFS